LAHAHLGMSAFTGRAGLPLNISVSKTSKRPDAFSLEVDMRRRRIGLTLGALTIVTGSLARADDVGCCKAECSTTDASGANLHSMQRRDMTQADCESGFAGCDVTWRPEACPGVGGEMGIVRHPDTGER
jgi:hypothetical protein